MYLLIITTLLSFLSASTSSITKPILGWLRRPLKEERDLTAEISALRKEQTEISMMDNFAAHAKLQRKINNLEIELKNVSGDRSTNNYAFQFGLTFAIRVCFGVIALLMIIYYRYTPVYIFPEYINLYPFNRIISYPNTEIGAVSVHFWLMVSNSVARQIIK